MLAIRERRSRHVYGFIDLTLDIMFSLELNIEKTKILLMFWEMDRIPLNCNSGVEDFT